MGLDISAYQGLTFAPPGQGLDENGYPDDSNGYFGVYINPDFAARAADLPNPCVCASSTGSMGFRAGSYGSYSRWREQLAHMAGYPALVDEEGHSGHAVGAWAVDSGPFWELIHFSDCEGAIGPSISAKLSADFQEHMDAAHGFDAAHEGGGYFLSNYQEFAKAFAMAADGGAVSFH